MSLMIFFFILAFSEIYAIDKGCVYSLNFNFKRKNIIDQRSDDKTLVYLYQQNTFFFSKINFEFVEPKEINPIVYLDQRISTEYFSHDEPIEFDYKQIVSSHLSFEFTKNMRAYLTKIILIGFLSALFVLHLVVVGYIFHKNKQ